MSVERPRADHRQTLVPHEHVRYPHGLVVARDRQRGVLIECVCGERRWSTFGHARRHAERCPDVLTGRQRGKRARAVRGHRIVRDAVPELGWRCSCGNALSRTRRVAREVMRYHRADVLSA